MLATRWGDAASTPAVGRRRRHPCAKAGHRKIATSEWRSNALNLHRDDICPRLRRRTTARRHAAAQHRPLISGAVSALEAQRRGTTVIGRTVSHYRIVEQIGEGGMGVVYRAVDTKLDRTVALKFLPESLTRDEEARERFLLEARAISALEHPNICTIHEIDETDDGRLFISMACYEGETLKSTLEGGPLGVADAARIASETAEGLAEAHRLGIVHRDVKPANIFVKVNGRVKILDFGLAILAGQSDLTRASSTVGTAAYMSPEQVQGGDVGPGTDVWSLGVVMYEMLTGRSPFEAEYEQAVFYRIMTDDPTPVEELRPETPPALAPILARCLEKAPQDRYRTMDDLLADLNGAEVGPGAQKSKTGAGVPGRRPSRGPTRTLIGVAALLVLAAVLLAVPPGRDFIRRRLLGIRDSGGKLLAVLPFTPTPATTVDAAFSDGFVEHLTFRLSQLEELEGAPLIVPADEIRESATTTSDEAADALGATLALDGEIDRGGDLVGIQLELLDPRSRMPLESWTTTQRIGNVSVLQQQVVASVAIMLGVELDEDALRLLAAGGTTVPGAFESYLKGLGFLRDAENDSVAVERAVRLFTEAIGEDPGYALAHAALGEALWRRCRRTSDETYRLQAIASLTRSIELSNALAAPNVVLSEICAAAGDYEGAVGHAENALDVDPGNLPALNQLASLHDKLGRPDEAESLYEDAARARPSHWAVHTRLGIFYRSRGRYEDSAKAFRRAVALAPGNAVSYGNLGVVYYEMERYEDALDMLERANEIDPSYSGYANLATFHFHEGRYADAARMYERALEIDGSDYRVWGNLGSSYLWVPGHREEALEAYRTAAARAEDARGAGLAGPEVLCLLGGYYAEIGRPDTALALTEQALAEAPRNVEIMFQAGHNYEVLGDRTRALRFIESALENGYSRDQVERTPALRGLCTDPDYRRVAERTADRS
ncbi:MAG: protein kinase [Candidatus Eisenbacteria bacterium]|nr:protein kinase [Candidatus Eisenbacteria bacterium]